MHWYLGVLRRYADFNGRARRMEFWMFQLINAIIQAVLGVVDGLIFGWGATHTGWFTLVYGLAVLLPALAVGVRRLHDTGRSGWWLLLTVIPALGWIVLLVFDVLPGNRTANRFGPDPKASAA